MIYWPCPPLKIDRIFAKNATFPTLRKCFSGLIYQGILNRAKVSELKANLIFLKPEQAQVRVALKKYDS
jgi:hypothetical protein